MNHGGMSYDIDVKIHIGRGQSGGKYSAHSGSGTQQNQNNSNSTVMPLTPSTGKVILIICICLYINKSISFMFDTTNKICHVVVKRRLTSLLSATLRVSRKNKKHHQMYP
jgi:hypothetical protein